MNFKYLIFSLTCITLITLGIILGSSYISSEDNKIKLSENESKTSKSEVNNINEKQLYVDKGQHPKVSISSKDELSDLITSNMSQGKDTLATIKDSSIRNDLNQIALNVSRTNGYSGYISALNYGIRGNDISIHFEYKNGTDAFLNQIKTVNSKVQGIISQIIKPGMNDYNKELAIHNYIINNTKYDSSNLERNTLTPEDFTAYGVFINGTAVCEGYAEAMFRLLNAANIENHIVYGTANNIAHAWNIVKIDDNYYHADATFDDPISDIGPILGYGYFNVSDTDVAINHKWDSTKYPPCKSNLENYYTVNSLVAKDKKTFYSILKKGLLKKQPIIRCKTTSFSPSIFNLEIVSEVLSDNRKINYVNTEKPLVYQYDKTTCEMQIFVNYK